MRARKQVDPPDMSPRRTTVRRISHSIMGNQLVRATSRRLSKQKQAQSAAEMFHVRCSRPVFAVFWLGILFMHTLCAAYFGFAAYLYPYIMKRSLGLNLRTYALRLPESAYTWVSYAYVAIAVPHSYCVLHMLFYSICYRRLVFESTYSSRISSPKLTSRLHSKMVSPKFCSAVVSRKIFFWRKWLFGHTGLFGLGGPHFRTIFLIQEGLEIVLQTVQAYRMSCWLPRAWLNRQFVALLIFNCWSTNVIQRFTGNNLPLERLLVFLAGLITDLVSMIGVPVILSIPYAKIYNYDRGSFVRSYWYDDVWLINMVNEAQIILVTSVWDILGKLVFSTTLLMTFMVVKSLLRPETVRTSTVAAIGLTSSPSSAPSIDTISESPVEVFSVPTTEAQPFDTTPVEVFNPVHKDVILSKSNMIRHGHSTIIDHSESNSSIVSVHPHNHQSALPTMGLIPTQSNFAGPRFFAFQDKLVHWGHRFFLMWGLLILIVQIHADHLPEPQLCGLRVRPWFQSKPSCSLLEVDCYKLNLTGAVNEIKSAMDQMNQPVLAHVVFRHCPNLQMPPNLKLLSRLIGFKVFNSTLTRWEQDAALTNTNNPRLTFMFMVKVNMTELPQGLQTNDYPKHMTDVEFSTTNLTTLPADLHTKWPKGMVLVLERAKFNHVPDVLKRMQVGYLGFGENNVTDVPIEIFTHPYARSIWLNGNPITRLPDGPVLSSLAKVRMVNSNVSVETLPPWVASTLLTHATFVAGGTPLCAMIAKLKAAGTDMSALGEPLAKVYKNVVCTAFTGDLFTYYPLSLEDKYNAGTY
ncbi:hypothetical protein Gpo141_00008525 [Globisporangium polare]